MTAFAAGSETSARMCMRGWPIKACFDGGGVKGVTERLGSECQAMWHATHLSLGVVVPLLSARQVLLTKARCRLQQGPGHLLQGQTKQGWWALFTGKRRSWAHWAAPADPPLFFNPSIKASSFVRLARLCLVQLDPPSLSSYLQGRPWFLHGPIICITCAFSTRLDTTLLQSPIGVDTSISCLSLQPQYSAVHQPRMRCVDLAASRGFYIVAL
jgi:hypothetical protein